MPLGLAANEVLLFFLTAGIYLVVEVCFRFGPIAIMPTPMRRAMLPPCKVPC
jgi:hypothetical protein